MYGAERNREVEKGLAIAYLYLGQREEAALQAEYFLQAFGPDDAVNAALKGIRAGTITFVER